MIIPNGYISIRHKTGGGIDPETGHPIRLSSVVYGEPIPCQIIPNKYNMQFISEGEHVTEASYQVLIDRQGFDAEQVRLTDRTGKVIGDYSLQWIESLDAVDEIRLWV